MESLDNSVTISGVPSARPELRTVSFALVDHNYERADRNYERAQVRPVIQRIRQCFPAVKCLEKHELDLYDNSLIGTGTKAFLSRLEKHFLTLANSGSSQGLLCLTMFKHETFYLARVIESGSLKGSCCDESFKRLMGEAIPGSVGFLRYNVFSDEDLCTKGSAKGDHPDRQFKRNVDYVKTDLGVLKDNARDRDCCLVGVVVLTLRTRDPTDRFFWSFSRQEWDWKRMEAMLQDYSARGSCPPAPVQLTDLQDGAGLQQCLDALGTIGQSFSNISRAVGEGVLKYRTRYSYPYCFVSCYNFSKKGTYPLSLRLRLCHFLSRGQHEELEKLVHSQMFPKEQTSEHPKLSGTMATGSSREDVCPLCLDTYENPKFLPCHHTFCGRCIEGLAGDHPDATFPCPSCRRPTSLPTGGVSSLPTNFYIKLPAPQKKPGAQGMCKVHKIKTLEFYCVKCVEAICLNCKLTKHEHHETDDLTSAAVLKKENLRADQQRLENAVTYLIQGVTSLQEDRQSCVKKRAAVEKSIRNRHAIIVAAADKKMAEELNSLRVMYKDLDTFVDRAIEQRESEIAELMNIQQQLTDTITTGTANDVIDAAKEMKSGRGSQQVLHALMSREESLLPRPVLHFNVSTDVMIQTTRDYVGSVRKMEMKKTKPEMKVTERFQCAQDPDVEIFSLCHRDSEPCRLYVSYERCGMKEDAPCHSFTDTGKCLYMGAGDEMGKLSYKRVAEGRTMYVAPQPGWFTSFCKSPTAALCRLENNLSGQAHVMGVTVKSTNPVKTETKIEFTIQVGRHRAFDVDDTELYFTVLEDITQSPPQRRVRLYQRSVETAVSTYTPPVANCLPSDVCFYTLGGQRVLLITDELNDTIHVVTIHGQTMRFECYLCGGCPSLIQPTAITTDINGRLWVACRGGAILTLEPIA